jgi:molybdate transport system substrate-binding protein
MNSFAQFALRNGRVRRWGCFIALVGFLLSAPAIRAQVIGVAAASDLQFAMDDLASRYQKQTGQQVSVTYGSSGNFYAQIQAGAPFDVFFSADIPYAGNLIDAHLAEPNSLVIYARGQIVRWAPGDAHLNLSQNGFAGLHDSRVQKIAVANPDHAPYGRAAVAALQHAGLYGELKSKLVYGENISQAALFAQSGGAQVGILALSLAQSRNMKSGARWLIPSELDQPAVLLNSSANKAGVRAFLEFVKSEDGREVLSQHGFMLPNLTSHDAQRPKP